MGMLPKIYLCPADKKYGCTWEGPSDDIYEHFSQEHEDLLFLTGIIDIPLEATSENRLLFVDSEIYLFQTKLKEDHLAIFLRYLGPPKIAANITYDISISANGRKLRKEDIEIKNGCFSINLECIQACFGDISAISCQLLVSGDFLSISSNESVFSKEKRDQMEVSTIDEKPNNVMQSHTNETFGTPQELSPNLRDIFSTPKESDSPASARKKKFSFDETKRSSWNAPEENSSKERPSSLSRSQTFTSEDIKRNTAMRRQASMRSLSSIAESDLDSELKCSNCDAHLAPPIYLCVMRHNICVTCYRDRKICSVCQDEISVDRNEDLEGKCLNYLYVCMNKKNGCSRKLPFIEINDHEVNCTFCQYVCPMEECTYKSGYKNLLSHLSLIHSSVKIIESFIAVFNKYQEQFLANETMGVFYCSWRQVNDKIIWKAKFCGPKARKFFCELKFKGKHFKMPLLLTKHEDYYYKEMSVSELKEQKLKVKHSILTITR